MSIKKVYVEEIKHESKTSKAGKPYTTCSIKAEGQWMNGFGNKVTEGFQQGMTVEVEVYEEEYQGKTYKKFKTVTKEMQLEQVVRNLLDRVAKLEDRMDAVAKFLKEQFKS